MSSVFAGRRRTVAVAGPDAPADPDGARELLEWALARAQDGVERDGDRYRKGGPLVGAARRRWTVRAGLARRPLPRLAELANLAWLRREGVAAPRPLLAVAAFAGPVPLAQALETEALAARGTLRELLEGAPTDPRRARALDALAATLGRLHARGFAHGDCYPRNVLVTDEGVALLDAWRFSPRARTPLAHAARDLGGLLLHGALWLDAAEQHALLERYRAARADHGAAVDAGRLARAVERARAREVTRFRGHPERRRDLPDPPPRWSAPRVTP